MPKAFRFHFICTVTQINTLRVISTHLGLDHINRCKFKTVITKKQTRLIIKSLKNIFCNIFLQKKNFSENNKRNNSKFMVKKEKIKICKFLRPLYLNGTLNFCPISFVVLRMGFLQYRNYQLIQFWEVFDILFYLICTIQIKI